MESEPSIEELLALKAQYARDSQALEASLVKKGAKGAWQRSHDLCLFLSVCLFFFYLYGLLLSHHNALPNSNAQMVVV